MGVILRPVLTEKSMMLVGAGQYTFEVAVRSSKQQIAEAINQIFGVEVAEVRTNVRPGKTKRLVRQRKTVRTPKSKFAVVSLKKGQKIDGFDRALEIEEEDED